MSHLHPAIPVPAEIWPGIQPLAFQCNQLPRVNPELIEWRTPLEIAAKLPNKDAQERKRFISLFSDQLRYFSFTSEELEKFSLKASDPVTQGFAEILYARWSGKLNTGYGLEPVTLDGKTAMAQKIQEGVGHCPEGFADRLQDLVNALTSPKTFDEFLCAIRTNLVERCAAAHSGGEIHASTRFQYIAAPIYRTPFPIPDPYVGAVRDGAILEFLSNIFREHFTFFELLNALTDQLKSKLLTCGYIGPNPPYKTSGGFPQFYANHTEKFTQILNDLFQTAPRTIGGAGAGAGAGSGSHAGPGLQREWFVIKDDDDEDLGIEYITDINWSYILKKIATKLISEAYIRLTRSELEALIKAQIYDPSMATRRPIFAPDTQPSIFASAPKSLIEFFRCYSDQALTLTQRSEGMKTSILSLIDNAREILFQLIKNRPEAVKPFLDLIKSTSITSPSALDQALNGSETTPLMLAASRGNIELVDLFLKNGAKVNLTNQSKLSALNYAIAAPSAEITLLLLNAEATASKETLSKAFHLALRKGHIPLLEALVKKGVDIKTLDSQENSALTLAFIYKKFDLARYLLREPIPIFSPREIRRKNAQRFSAFQIACLNNAPSDILEKLIVHGGERAVDEQAMMPGHARLLMETCRLGHTEAARVLLKHGAKIDDVDANGDTALTQAIQERKWGTASLLIHAAPSSSKAHSITRRINALKLTPLMLAVFSKTESDAAPLDFIRLLLSKGGLKDLNYTFIKDGKSFSALGIAVRSKNFNIAQLLLEAGAEISKETAQEIFEHEMTKNPEEINPPYIHFLLSTPEFSASNCLIKAIEKNDILSAKFLLEHFPGLSSQKEETSGQPTFFAIANQKTPKNLLLIAALTEPAPVHLMGPPGPPARPISFPNLDIFSLNLPPSEFLARVLAAPKANYRSEIIPEGFDIWICRALAQLPQRVSGGDFNIENCLIILSALKIDKYKLFEMIRNLEDPSLKMQTLEAILERAPQDGSSLGAELFWKKRKFTHKSKEKGTLRQLNEIFERFKTELKINARIATPFKSAKPAARPDSEHSEGAPRSATTLSVI
jgi:ankyrin repeat protein